MRRSAFWSQVILPCVIRQSSDRSGNIAAIEALRQSRYDAKVKPSGQRRVDHDLRRLSLDVAGK
jgi:hypothetical protein